MRSHWSLSRISITLELSLRTFIQFDSIFWRIEFLQHLNVLFILLISCIKNGMLLSYLNTLILISKLDRSMIALQPQRLNLTQTLDRFGWKYLANSQFGYLVTSSLRISSSCCGHLLSTTDKTGHPRSSQGIS